MLSRREVNLSALNEPQLKFGMAIGVNSESFANPSTMHSLGTSEVDELSVSPESSCVGSAEMDELSVSFGSDCVGIADIGELLVSFDSGVFWHFPLLLG